MRSDPITGQYQEAHAIHAVPFVARIGYPAMMKYAIALIMLSAGLAIGYAAGWRTTQPSEAERTQARAYEWRAKEGRRVNANDLLRLFAQRIAVRAKSNSDIAALVQSLKSPMRFEDPAHIAPEDVGRCVSWEYRLCPDAKLWNGPDPANDPDAETHDLAWAQFRFVDGWVFTTVYSNWKSPWGTWENTPHWHGGQPPEWFDRAVIIKGTVQPRADGQGFESIFE